jgi:hypothetical protein
MYLLIGRIGLEQENVQRKRMVLFVDQKRRGKNVGWVIGL